MWETGGPQMKRQAHSSSDQQRAEKIMQPLEGYTFHMLDSASIEELNFHSPTVPRSKYFIGDVV